MGEIVAKEVRERRLKWYGHVIRREEHCLFEGGPRVMEMKVQGRRKRGRPKRIWLDRVRGDIKEKGLSAEEVCNCHRTSTPHKSWNKIKR